MAGMEPLIALSDLKKTLLEGLIRENRLHPTIKYEQDFDALIINFGPPDVDVVVYYLDDRIGLLFDDNTLEIIGLQIEDFEQHFVATRANIRQVWHDTGDKPKDVGEMIIAVEAKATNVRRELGQTLHDELLQQDADLLKVLM